MTIVLNEPLVLFLASFLMWFSSAIVLGLANYQLLKKAKKSGLRPRINVSLFDALPPLKYGLTSNFVAFWSKTKSEAKWRKLIKLNQDEIKSNFELRKTFNFTVLASRLFSLLFILFLLLSLLVMCVVIYFK